MLNASVVDMHLLFPFHCCIIQLPNNSPVEITKLLTNITNEGIVSGQFHQIQYYLRHSVLRPQNVDSNPNVIIC